MYLSTKKLYENGTQAAKEAEAEQAAQNSVLTLPTGDLVDLKNVDEVISKYQEVAEAAGKLYEAKKALSHALWAMTEESDKKTRRVRGESRIVAVAQPSDYWDQSVLQEAWNAFPKFRDEAMKIATLRVKAREWKKIVSSKGPKSFETFKEMVNSANRGPSGTPRVTVEK